MPTAKTLDYPANEKWINEQLKDYPFKAHRVVSNGDDALLLERGPVWASAAVSPTIRLYAFRILSDRNTMRSHLIGLQDDWPQPKKPDKTDYLSITRQMLGR